MRKNTKKFSLANIKILPKLLLVMLVLSWIPLAGVTSIGIKSRNNAIAYEMGNTILEVISGAAQDIRQGTINMVMENLTVAQNILLDPTILNYALNYTPGSVPKINALEALALYSRLQEFTDSTPSLQKIEIHDPSGTVLISTDPANIGINNSMRTDLQEVILGSNFAESILMDVQQNTFSMFVSIPFKNQSGIVGIISLQLQAEFINTLIQDVSDETGVNIFVMDTNGVILAHSDESSDWLYRSTAELSPEVLEQYQAVDNSPTLAVISSLSPLYQAVEMATETNTSGRFRFCHPDQPDHPLSEDCATVEWSQIAYEILPDPIHQTPMFLVAVEVLESPYTSAAVQQTVVSIISAIVIGIILVTVSIIVARSMAKPIQRMAEAAQMVENEVDFNPETLADISTQQDEIGMLSQVFSNMVVSLEKCEKKLKKEIVKLKIEIDAQKQQEEIDEIVNQDFFQELQKKAKDFKKDKR